MKRITAWLLVLVMIVSCGCPSLTTEAMEKTEAPIVTTDNNSATAVSTYQVEATNSVGEIFYNELSPEISEAEDNLAYLIRSVEMDGVNATVSYTSDTDCTLVVGIYDEAGKQLLASGKTEVLSEEESATVVIDTTTMPEYYLVRAYLVDAIDLSPLSVEYESPMYTQAMQEFMDMTIEDFDEDRVLNLDESIDNNFAVYKEGVIVTEETDEYNQLLSYDETTGTYVIENADTQMQSLKSGDVFALETENEVYIETVKSVSVEGTTVTVVADQTTMEEVFDYVKIDVEGGTSDMSYDPSTRDEGVGDAIDAEYPEDGVYPYPIEDESAIINNEPDLNTSGKDAEGTGKAVNSKLLPLDRTYKNGASKVTIKGGLLVSPTVKVSIYMLPPDHFLDAEAVFTRYVEFQIDFKASLGIKITANINKTISLGSFGFSPFAGVYVDFTPSIILNVSGTIEINAEYTATVGFKATLKPGIKNNKLENISKEQKFKPHVKLNVNASIGFSFEPSIGILHKSVASATLTAKLTAEISATLQNDELGDTVKHDCVGCISGEIFGKLDLNCSIKLFDQEWLTLKLELVNHKHKFCDFYYSSCYGEFALTKCPHKKSKVTVMAIENAGQENEAPLMGVCINDTYYTDKNGKAVFYMVEGKHKITASKDGYVSQTKEILVIEDESTGTYFTMVQGEDTSDAIVIDESTFPDANFRQYVLDNIDADGNGELSNSEIEGTTKIDCSYLKISDLSGINYFYKLSVLNCSGNILSTLDVSDCVKLTELYCSDNNLSILDVSDCVNLTKLSCNNNSLSTLDVNDCVNLTKLYCVSNNLSTLDVSNCVGLTYLQCESNNLGTLDVNNCINLTTLYCESNNLSTLDASDCINLNTLWCHNNNLSTLDVSNCAIMKDLRCNNNNLSTLDVGDCTNLNTLECYSNNLSALDVSKCIGLIKLICYSNNLSTLDVSSCINLNTLRCHNNNLSTLDASNCTKMGDLRCYSNKLSTLEVGDCVNLSTLECNNNNLSILDVSNCTKLKYLRCYSNKLSSLEVSGCVNLDTIECHNNNLTTLDVSNCTKLKYFHCYSNKLSTMNVSGCVNLYGIDCNSNNLTTLDMNNCVNLGGLHCENNKLITLDVSDCVDLRTLVCYGNALSTLEVSNCINLTYLDCDSTVTIIGYSGTSSTSLSTVSPSADNVIDTNTDIGMNNSSYEDIDVNTYSPVTETYQSSTTSTVRTIHKVTIADDNHIDYADLYPSVIYNLYVVKEFAEDDSFGDALTNDNLLYIKQYTADENGELVADYYPITDYEGATEILVCNKKINISEGYEIKITNLEHTGMEQSPIVEVKHNGDALAEGKDYVLLGDFIVADIGDYTITVRGIGIYEGDVDINYSVLKPVVNVEFVKIDDVSLTIEKGNVQKLNVTVLPADATNKTLTWASSNPSVATVDDNGNVTAIEAGTTNITATAADGSGVSASCKVTVTTSAEEPKPEEPETPKYYPTIKVSYRTHIQSYGWEGNADDITTWKSNGTMSGTSGKAKRLEGINIVVNSAESGKDVDLGIQYITHCQSYGWLPWSADGDMNGTEGEAKRLEAIKIQLTGADKDAYDVYYRVHAQSYGWLGWAKNGEPSGTAGYAKRLEGIQIVVVKKGEAFDQNMEGITSSKTEAYIAKDGSSPIVNYPATSNTNPIIPGADTPNVTYRTHVQSFGWQGWKYNGQMSGTSGLAKRLEGININLTNTPYDGDIVYTTHVQTYGWQGQPDDATRSGWKKNGEMSGTSGEAKRLEAICIDLTGEMAEHYDIYYRVHAQSFGWLGWAKNGDESGTAGYAKRLEGIQIVLVPKGGTAPADNYGGVISNRAETYIEK